MVPAHSLFYYIWRQQSCTYASSWYKYQPRHDNSILKGPSGDKNFVEWIKAINFLDKVSGIYNFIEKIFVLSGTILWRNIFLSFLFLLSLLILLITFDDVFSYYLESLDTSCIIENHIRNVQESYGNYESFQGSLRIFSLEVNTKKILKIIYLFIYLFLDCYLVALCPTWVIIQTAATLTWS